MNAALLSSAGTQPRRGDISTSDFPAITPSKGNDVCHEDSKMESDKDRRCLDLIAEGDNSSATTSECQDFGDNEEVIAFGAGINNISEKDFFPVQTSVSTLDVFKKPGALSSMPTANDANFVSEFYNNSRLHYLSTWGAEFKKYTSDIIKCSTAKGFKSRGLGRVGPHGRVIMHIDMDSFFVSVTLRDKPHLRGKPIAVCHAGKGDSTNDQGQTSPRKPSSFFNSMSEIASCSYEARAAGVRNGMFLGSARKLCPDIHCVPYQFEEYRKVSQRLYDILMAYSHEIEAVSCDEAYIDVSETLEEDESPTQLAEKIRGEIKESTGCTASVGIGANVLLARMCTRVAKPNGCYHVAATDDVNHFMGTQKATDLPGVGWALGQKLETLGVKTCVDLQKLTLRTLQREFGPKTGLLLHQYCRGVDERTLKTERERKSVSAEINYGIRFTKESEVVNFINELAKEVQKRVQALETRGRCITLKMKVRKAGAPTPRKFMGHGICDNIARSCTIPSVTDDAQVISKQCHALLKQLNVTPEDMRGMGIQVSKLDDKNSNTDSKNSRSLFDFMKPKVTSTEDIAVSAVLESQVEKIVENEAGSVSKSPENEGTKLPRLPRFSPQIAEYASVNTPRERLGGLDESLYLPSPSQIDPSVLEALPDDIRRSIERSYAARNEKRSLNGNNEQVEPECQPQTQQKATKPRQCKVALKAARSLFEENSSLESAQQMSDLLPSPSQIDPEFLLALPDHVRQEIEQAYRVKNLKLTRGRGEAVETMTHNVEVPQTKQDMKMSTEHVQEGGIQNTKNAKINTPTEQARLGEAVTLPQVKQVITQWTQAYEVPLREDIAFFTDYLLQLVETKNLEQLWRVLRFLDRTVDGRQDWQTVSYAVLTEVQKFINWKYGTKLAVNSFKFTKYSVAHLKTS